MQPLKLYHTRLITVSAFPLSSAGPGLHILCGYTSCAAADLCPSFCCSIRPPLCCRGKHEHNPAAHCMLALFPLTHHHWLMSQTGHSVDKALPHARRHTHTHTAGKATPCVLSALQCVAIDPTEERIAAGDVSGRILIWKSFAHKVPKLQQPPPQPTPALPTAPAPTPSSAPAASPGTSYSPASASMPQAAVRLGTGGSASDSDSDDGSDAAQATASAASPAAAVGGPSNRAAEGSHVEQGSAVAAQSGAAQQARAVAQQSVEASQEPAAARFARLRQSVEAVPLTTVHWHAHPVGALCFSTDGALLLSGGQEAVLVNILHPVSLIFSLSHVSCSATHLTTAVLPISLHILLHGRGESTDAVGSFLLGWAGSCCGGQGWCHVMSPVAAAHANVASL